MTRPTALAFFTPWIPLALPLVLSACQGAEDDTDDTGTPESCAAGDNLCVMSTGEALATETWPDARIVDVVGMALEGTATATADFDRWLLVLVANDGSAAGNIELWWTADGAFEAPIYHDDPYYGVMDDPLPRTMGLDQALGLVRGEGYAEAINSVSLNKPLWPIVEARYAFMYDGGVVFVDVATSAVTADR